jgi:thiamine biosynthesis lipoprotein
LRARLESELERLAGQLSAWRPDSALSRFNDAAPGTWSVLPEDLFEVLAHALALARDTEGAYDPTIGPLVNAWGFGPQGAPRHQPPTRAELDAARARIGAWRLVLDAPTRRALQPGGVFVDVSSIAPGFAVDRLAATLRSEGIDDYLVELGGEVRAGGRKPDGSDWRVAVEAPPDAALDASTFDLVIALRDAAVGSSGDYRTGFVHAGRRYSHTIDPRSGEPVRHALAAVSVIASDAMQADALAAALMVLGPDAGWEHARARGLAAAFTVRHPEGGYVRRLTPEFERWRAP